MDEVTEAMETIDNAEQEATEHAGEIISDAHDTSGQLLDDAQEHAEDIVEAAYTTAKEIATEERFGRVESRLDALEAPSMPDTVVIAAPTEEHHEDEPVAETEPEPVAEPETAPELPEPDIAPSKRNSHWYYR
jgi:hypothetical protein